MSAVQVDEAYAEPDGPFDATDLDLEQTDAVGRLDFSSLRVPMPDGARLQVEKLPDGRLKAVHVLVDIGRLSVSALAAPKSGKLWTELADEVARSLQTDGARVRVEAGRWGREVIATAGEAQSRFIGVDGARWMLYGISTGPAEYAAEAADILRDMIRGTIVVRGAQPYPVRTVLPLTVPPHLAPLLARIEAANEQADQPAASPAEEPLGAPAESAAVLPARRRDAPRQDVPLPPLGPEHDVLTPPPSPPSWRMVEPGPGPMPVRPSFERHDEPWTEVPTDPLGLPVPGGYGSGGSPQHPDQESAWLSIDTPDVTLPRGTGRHRADDGRSGRHHRPEP